MAGSFLRDFQIIRVNNTQVQARAWLAGLMPQHWRGCQVHWYIQRKSGGAWEHESAVKVGDFGTDGLVACLFTVPTYAIAVKCHYAVLIDVGAGQYNGTPIFATYNGNPRTTAAPLVSNTCRPRIARAGAKGAQCTWTCSNSNVDHFEAVFQGKYNGSWSKISSTNVSYSSEWNYTINSADQTYTHLRACVRPVPSAGEYRCDFVYTGEIVNPAWSDAEAEKMAAPPAPSLSVTVSPYDNRATLSWSSSGDLAKRFDVYRLDNSGRWVKRGSVNWTSTRTAYTYTDSALSPGSVYKYMLRAVNTYRKANSYRDSNIVVDVVCLPAVPTSLAATVTESNADSASADVRMSWAHPGDAKTRSGFDAQWTPDDFDSAGASSASVEATSRSYEAKGLTANVKYRMRVRAKNSLGNSAWTSAISITPKVPPRTPSVAVELTDRHTVKVTVTSTDTAAKTCKVYRKPPQGDWACIATLDHAATVIYEDVGTAPGGKYLYSARLVLPDNSTYSDYAEVDEVSGWIEREPSAPTGLAARASAVAQDGETGTVRLSWHNTGLTGDQVTVRYTDDESVDLLGDSTGYQTQTFETTSETCEIAGLATASTWRFAMYRSNDTGDSAFAEAEEGGNIVTAVVATTPEAPTLVATKPAYVSGDTIELEWVHNNKDGSIQENAQVQVKVNDGEWSDAGTDLGDNTWLDYTPECESGDSVYWRVRTKGLAEWGPWSESRMFRVWAPFNPSVVLASPNGELQDMSLDALPLIVSAEGETDGTGENDVIEWWCELISVGGYETTAADGSRLLVADGEVAWSKTIKAGTPEWMDEFSYMCQFDIGAQDMRFSGMYRVLVGCLTAQGLPSEAAETAFACTMTGEVPEPELTATIDETAYTCILAPSCWSETEVPNEPAEPEEPEDDEEEPGGDADIPDDPEPARVLESGVTLSVYRVEQDGSTTPIALNMDNDGYSRCVDEYPSFGKCTYRVVAMSSETGVQSYSELTVTVPVPGVFVQWAGGSVLLPFNLELSESYEPDVALMEYSGRADPVSVYGTQLGRKASWKAEVSKREGTAEVAALRALGRNMADCHVRDTSGMSYQAHVRVSSITRSNTSAAVTVQLEVTRVEA